MLVFPNFNPPENMSFIYQTSGLVQVKLSVDNFHMIPMYSGFLYDIHLLSVQHKEFAEQHKQNLSFDWLLIND